MKILKVITLSLFILAVACWIAASLNNYGYTVQINGVDMGGASGMLIGGLVLLIGILVMLVVGGIGLSIVMGTLFMAGIGMLIALVLAGIGTIFVLGVVFGPIILLAAVAWLIVRRSSTKKITPPQRI